MATFGKASLKKLATCDADIQKVMHEAIKHYNFTVIFGNRSAEEQFKLFKIGRTLIKGAWTVTGKVVTNLDGKIKLSEHNHFPSKAIDIAPWPIDWNNIAEFKKMAKVVKDAAVTVGVEIEWGGDWKKFIDYPHFQIK